MPDYKTEVIHVNPITPEPRFIKAGSRILHDSGLVAFPTETVYGLGANALDRDAVSSIFLAKGRPTNNPLIVHVANSLLARIFSNRWPDEAQLLADKFWPGPLSIVVEKSPVIPDVVSAGKPTVALRVPANPIALALLDVSNLPIAAPSANRSEELSPTRAEHVLQSLGGRIPLILDGGPTLVGIESTVISLTESGPRLLRPGAISPAEIEAVIGPIQRPDGAGSDMSELASPGLMLRHYAPRAPLSLVTAGADMVADKLASGERVGWLTWQERSGELLEHVSSSMADEAAGRLVVVLMPARPDEYASVLYAHLHDLDNLAVSCIVVDAVPDTEEWLGVRDRLTRASYRP